MAELGGLIEGGRVGASKTPNLSQGNNNFRSNVWSVGPGGLCQARRPLIEAVEAERSNPLIRIIPPILLNISALPCLIECPIST